jgi:hypothetical protein
MMFADIAWKIDEEAQRLELTWSEKGGPLVSVHRDRVLGHVLSGHLANS